MKTVLLFLLLSSHAVLAQTQKPATPQLFFSYSFLYDQNCPDSPEKDLWAQEAKSRTEEFANIWKRAEPILFGKVYEIFGKGFSRKELTATLSVCKGPSFSNPLVLNIRPYLKSVMRERAPLSDDAFADLVFHELLHTWLVENLRFSSPLRQKYAQETPRVRSHLHLIAMQIFIYNEIKRPDLTEMISQGYKAMPVDYQRAWQIVSEIEGYQPFINELKDPSPGE